MKQLSVALFLLVLIISACSSDDDTGKKRYGKTPDEVELDIPTSRLNLPIQIPLDELQKAINAKLPNEIVSKREIKGGLRLSAIREGAVKLTADGKNLAWSVPLRIKIYRGKSEKQLSEFVVEPAFISEVGIKKDYSLSSKSKLATLEFKDQAQVSLLGLDIDVTNIIDQQIRKNEAQLTEKIDHEISKVSIDKMLQRTWNKLRSPIRINKNYVPIYLLGKPTEAIFHDYFFKNNYLYLDITLMAELQTVYDSAANIPKEFKYPPLKIETRQIKGFDLNLGVPVNYSLIDSVTNALLTNKPFEVEGEALKIDSIHIYALDTFLVIYSKISGDWSAEMEVYGRPSYDEKTKVVSIKGFDFFIKDETSSLFQATDYLFHQEIKEQVLSNLHFEMGSLIDTLPEVIYGAIEKGKSGDKINLKTSIDNAKVKNVLIGAEQLIIVLQGNGQASLEVEKLKKK